MTVQLTIPANIATTSRVVGSENNMFFSQERMRLQQAFSAGAKGDMETVRRVTDNIANNPGYFEQFQEGNQRRVIRTLVGDLNRYLLGGYGH